MQDEENGLLDVLVHEGQETPAASLLHDSLRREVQRARSTLTRREADVLTLHCGLNGHAAQTLEEVGAHFSLTRERVRQLKEKAIRCLNHTSRLQSLKSYLG